MRLTKPYILAVKGDGSDNFRVFHMRNRKKPLILLIAEGWKGVKKNINKEYSTPLSIFESNRYGWKLFEYNTLEELAEEHFVYLL